MPTKDGTKTGFETTAKVKRAVSEQNERFMRAFKRYRMARGLTLEAIAGKLGVATSTVGNWESGRNLPTSTIVPKLARVLEVDPLELTTIISPEPPPRPIPGALVH